MSSLIRLDPRQLPDEIILEHAWRIANEREEWYGEMGAGETFESYLAAASSARRADFALLDEENRLITLITVDVTGPWQFSLNLTSRPGAPFELVRNAVYTVGARLFLECQAEEVWTKIPSFHRASRKLTSQCGLSPNGEETTSATFRGRPIRLIRYSLDRETFLREHHINGQTGLPRDADLHEHRSARYS
jgi:hypothetical protein